MSNNAQPFNFLKRFCHHIQVIAELSGATGMIMEKAKQNMGLTTRSHAFLRPSLRVSRYEPLRTAIIFASNLAAHLHASNEAVLRPTINFRTPNDPDKFSPSILAITARPGPEHGQKRRPIPPPMQLPDKARNKWAFSNLTPRRPLLTARAPPPPSASSCRCRPAQSPAR